MFAQALMSGDAGARFGAQYNSRSPERTNRRNGYRQRRWDTRVGTIPLAIPRLRVKEATSRSASWSVADAPSKR